jgi:hypothetical protein
MVNWDCPESQVVEQVATLRRSREALASIASDFDALLALLRAPVAATTNTVHRRAPHN